MNNNDLWEKKQDLLNQINDLTLQAREPNHSHDFYDEVAKEIKICEKQIDQLDRIFNNTDWHRDLHRLITEFKIFTGTEKHLSRIIYVLTSRLSIEERRRLINRLDHRNLVEEAERKELKKEIRRVKKKERRIKQYRQQFPKYASLSDEEILIKAAEEKRIKDIQKNKEKLAREKTQQRILDSLPKKDPTEESIKYWREKWGITEASLETNKNE